MESEQHIPSSISRLQHQNLLVSVVSVAMQDDLVRRTTQQQEGRYEIQKRHFLFPARTSVKLTEESIMRSYLSIYQSIYLSFYLTIYVSLDLSMDLYLQYLSFSHSLHLHLSLSHSLYPSLSRSLSIYPSLSSSISLSLFSSLPSSLFL